MTEPTSPSWDASRRSDGNRSLLPPARFAYGRHTWKEIVHLLANLPLALLGFTYVVTVLFAGAFLTLTAIGLPLLAAGLMGARQLGKLERARARALLGVRVDEPSQSDGDHRRVLAVLIYLNS